MPELSVAHAVRALAGPLVQHHHPHLTDAKLLFIFTDQRRKRCDRVRLGSAGKLTALQRFLSSGMDSVQDGADFIIMIDENEWSRLDTAARTALVDHELCHCAVFVKMTDEKPAYWRRLAADDDKHQYEWKWGMRGHDIEEFGEVLYRHGFWKPDALEHRFGEIVAMQLKLSPEDEAAASNGSTSTDRRRRGKAVAEAE